MSLLGRLRAGFGLDHVAFTAGHRMLVLETPWGRVELHFVAPLATPCPFAEEDQLWPRDPDLELGVP